MRYDIRRRGLSAVVSGLLVWQLAACGAGDGGRSPTVSADPVVSATSPLAESGAVDADSATLIDAALAKGEINAETALTYKVLSLFGDARLPATYRGATDVESESAALEEASTTFNTLSPSAQQVVAPYLRRPADVGSWVSPASGGASMQSGCNGQAARWAAAGPAPGGMVKVWYDTAVAGDRATALAVAQAIDTSVWPGLMRGAGARPSPDDTASTGCDGGDARLDVYLVHGLRARGLTVPASSGADPAAVFTLVNADLAAETTANAAQAVMNAMQYARQVGSSQTSQTGDRRRALARAGGGVITAAPAAAALPVPAVVQMKAASLSSPVITVELDTPVTAGNWIAVAVSTLGATPANVSVSDNQANFNLGFAASGLRYGSSFGVTWRYVKLASSGAYTLTVDRAGASSGTVQVLELGNVDGTTFLDVGAVSASGNSTTPGTTFSTSKTTNDLLLSVVAVRSATATVTPTSPVGSTLAGATLSSLATASVLAFNTSILGRYRMAASLAVANPWRMSSLAVRGAVAPPAVAIPTNTALPVITVTDNIASLGLSTTIGIWANDPTAYAYSWTRNGMPISGATLAAYTTTEADQGSSVAAVVTASNSAGAASATSVAVPVPVPSRPLAPSAALTATPTSVVQGQPATLAWSSTAATACTASGGWSGGRPVSGSLAVTPMAPTTYALECTGPGGTATASVAVDVTVPLLGSTPTLGANALVFHISKGSVGPWLSTPPLTTQSGSTLVALVGKGSLWNLSPPIDNKGNTPWAQIGAIHEYTSWPGQGTAMYAFNSIVGGPNHIVSVEDANVWDEVTFALVEVKNGGVIQDYKWNEVLKPGALTSQSVTTTGPATLIAVWYGDDASSTPSNPVPNNGFTVIQGNGNATESVQMFVATKDVPGPGTYNVTWNTTPVQGAQLYLIAVQKR